MTKTLYFEGAGWFEAEHNGVGNCRIRTAFINNEGKQIYLEMGRAPRYDEKHKVISEFALWIDFIFYITDDPEIDDCNNSRIPYDYQELRNNYNYTKEDITKAVNKLCNTNFDTIEVLPKFEGYRVHADHGRYNLIDNHEVNIKRAKAREKAYSEFDNKIKAMLNEKYSKIHMHEMNEDSITIKINATDQSIEKAGITERLHVLKVS